MRKPTDAEIETEIEVLRSQRERVRRYTAFGDDNFRAIDVQIEALEGRFEEEDVYDRVDEAEYDDREKDCALEAVQWMSGAESERPSNGWVPLFNV